MINFCIRYACPIVICDTAVGASCHAPPERTGQWDVTVLFRLLNAWLSGQLLHHYLLLYFFFSHPYWTWVNSSATYVTYHFLPQAKMTQCYCWPTKASNSTGEAKPCFSPWKSWLLVSCQLKSIVSGALWLSAVRVHVPKPKFFSGFITSKPI